MGRVLVGAPEGVSGDLLPIPVVTVDPVFSDLDQGGAYSYLIAKHLARDRPGGDPHRGFTGTGATAPTVITDAIFLQVAVIGMTGAELVLDVVIVF